MNLAKSFDFFNPEEVDETIYILGCGATGSVLAEMLARLGLEDICLYDFDEVEEKNIANQMFRQKDVGRKKTDAVLDIMAEINPELNDTVEIHGKFEPGDHLEGYVFLCVDNIELRKEIVESCNNNSMVKAIFDFRIGLTDAQHYAADWTILKDRKRLLSTMQFTHEEANNDTPVSMCNEVMSVAPTNRTIVAFGVANFMNLVQNKPLKRTMFVDAFNFTIEAYE